jgi:hypothetical protein
MSTTQTETPGRDWSAMRPQDFNRDLLSARHRREAEKPGLFDLTDVAPVKAPKASRQEPVMDGQAELFA